MGEEREWENEKLKLVFSITELELQILEGIWTAQLLSASGTLNTIFKSFQIDENTLFFVKTSRGENIPSVNYPLIQQPSRNAFFAQCDLNTNQGY